MLIAARSCAIKIRFSLRCVLLGHEMPLGTFAQAHDAVDAMLHAEIQHALRKRKAPAEEESEIYWNSATGKSSAGAPRKTAILFRPAFTVPVHGRSLAGGSGLRFPNRPCGATALRAPLYPGASRLQPLDQ
jgi:hypothetical protein